MFTCLVDCFHGLPSPNISDCLLPRHRSQDRRRSEFGQMAQAAEASDFSKSRSQNRPPLGCESKRRAISVRAKVCMDKFGSHTVGIKTGREAINRQIHLLCYG